MKSFLFLWLGVFLTLSLVQAKEKEGGEGEHGGAEGGPESAELAAIKIYHWQGDGLVLSYAPKENGPTYFVSILYSVELADDESLKKIKKWKDRIGDSLLLTMTNYLRLYGPSVPDINMDHVLQIIKKTLGQVVDEKKIKNVVISDLRCEPIVVG